MRKIFWIFAILILGITAAAAYVWIARADLAARFLSKGMNVPVTIQSLDLSTNEATINNLWIGNPPKSKTDTAFSSRTIQIEASLKELRGDPLTIKLIELKNIAVGIEKYSKDSSDNNWAHILSDGHPSKKQDRNYLIETLILKNLTVSVTDADGKTKQYPTIARMEFHNISNETGFPVSEIEKAIFKLVMKELFKQYAVDLLKSFDPNQVINAPNNPLKWFSK